MTRSEELLEKANRRIPLSQREIADLINLAGVRITSARVFQLEKKAMQKLRDRAERLLGREI